jgi:chaperone required for assembly of F1-ATPase
LKFVDLAARHRRRQGAGALPLARRPGKGYIRAVRDIFDDLFRREPVDPVEAARRAVRPQLPRRFYRAAGVGEAAGGFRLLLDGRPAKTPARHVLAAPSRALAQAIADEWDVQGEHIDPARMPLTRLVNSILDGVRTAAAPVAAEIGRYLGCDLLFYRADVPALAARQAALWDPVLDWAREELGAKFILAEGVVFVAQPAAALAAARNAIPDDPWRLGALHSMTTLAGSALLALAVLRGRLGAEDARHAAHVDEDWNFEHWGRDALALARRAFRFAEMRAAARLLETLDAERAPVSLSLPPRGGGESGEDQRSEPGGGT